MSDLWLPPGAQPFDEDIERVIAESDDPEEMRAAAEGLREHGFKFPTQRFGDAIASPDSAVVLFAERWFRFENARGEWPLTAMVKSAEIERMLLDSTLEYENAMVANWTEHPILNALCPAVVVRLAQFQTFTPLTYEKAAAPDDWAKVVETDGFALAVAQEDEKFLYFSTGPMAPAGGLVMPAREGAKVGRNEKCPCGSGIKFKKCCGR